MNRKDWFRLASIFLVLLIYNFVSFSRNDCIEESFENFEDKSLAFSQAYDDYNLIQCAVEMQLYDEYFVIFGIAGLACLTFGIATKN